MKFIHIADVHLGAEPDAGSSYTENRAKELWNSLEQIVNICEEEKTDLLLIAGDLFHRQPLLRELKELNYMFAGLTHTKVVFIAGNHDYLKSSSFYRKFKWCDRVYPLVREEMSYVEFPRLKTCVYGLSYGQREITEPLYDSAFPMRRQPIEILLAHGGDKTHIPFQKRRLLELDYDYVALGHIHKPMELEEQKIYYAGALEPIDKNDTGAHGFIRGEIVNGKVNVEFIPIASREYVHVEVLVREGMTGRAVREKVAGVIRERGVQNIYKITLTGFREPEVEYDLSGMDVYGNIVELIDKTKPAYDYQKLMKQNEENLLGKFIMNMQKKLTGSVEEQALAEGVAALLETKRG